MPKGLVSILLCTYNGERFVSEQIESILTQSYKNFELVIVDDASSDNTYGICEKMAKKNKSIRLYRNDNNLGLNKNFEKAIKLAKGQYIAFSDQDDIWESNKIEILLDLLHSNTDVLVYCNSEMIDETGQSTHTSSMDHNVFVRGNESKQLLLYNTVSGHQMLFRKELVPYILPLPESFWYDWWIAYIATDKFSINYTGEKLVKYRIHRRSFVQKNKKVKKTRQQKIARIIQNLEGLNSSPVTDNKALISKLIKGYKNVMNNGISLGLFATIMKNRKELLFPRIRPTFGRLKRIRNTVKIALALKHLE